MYRFICLVLFSFLSLIPVFSQEPTSNDPHNDPNANACFEGGAMEGKCNQDFDEDGTIEDFEVTWAWQCGWFMIRFDAGIFSRQDIPRSCRTLVPGELPPFVQDNCYIWPDDANYQKSFLYLGPTNGVYNFRSYPNTDCSGTATEFLPSLLESIVTADTLSEAFTICRNLGPGILQMGGYPLQTVDPTAPANAWYCVIRLP